MSAKEIQEKLQETILSEIKKLPTDSLKKKLLLIKKVEGERNEIEEKGYLKEYNELKMVYDLKYQEYHEQLAKIALGEDNGTISEEDAKTYGITESEVKEAGIPEFWKKALMNSKFFEINDKDEEVLNHLKNVTLKLADDSLDFTVTFHFATNEFFEHATLYKSYVYDKQTFEPISATSSVITWNEGKNPSKKTKVKKIKKGKSIETKKTETNVPSFFDMFVAEESNANGESDIPAQAEFIRDELLLNSMEMFLDIQESEDYDMDDEDEEDEEDEDGEEGAAKKSKKKGDSKKAEKCKNQ